MRGSAISQLLHKRPGHPWLTLVIILLTVALLLPGAARAWEASDPSEPVFGADTKDAPYWLFGPATGSQLYSEYDLAYLAGQLIIQGAVDASACPGGAMLNEGTANECGVRAAHNQVLEWQNQFNYDIIGASKETGVPPMLIKNIFAWETQFWPKTIFVNTFEYGLGHITEAGADSALRWNYNFYLPLCRESFSDDTCNITYDRQPFSIRAALMGVVVRSVETNCPSCQYGMDLEKAKQSVYVFANTILANANLVNMTVTGLTGKPAIQSVNYNDLWKFSLVSYNAGPGCFRTAFSRTFHNYKKLNWDNLKNMLDPACQGAIKYVDFITRVDAYHPGDDPHLLLDATQQATPTATHEQSGTPNPTLETTAGVQNTPTEGSPEPTMQETPTPTQEITVTGTADVNPTQGTGTPESVTPTASVQPDVAAQLEAPHRSGEILLQVDPANQQQVLEDLAAMGVGLEQQNPQQAEMGTLLVRVDESRMADVLTNLQANPMVQVSEPNYLASSASLPNDPDISKQVNLWNIQVPQAWEAVSDLQDVLVAVVDTGIDLDHPDLTANIWQNPGECGLDANGQDKRTNNVDDDGNGYVDDWRGWNFVVGNNIPRDDQGHGTHLAGIIAAGVNNSLGIAGIAPNARLLAVKVLDVDGYSDYLRAAEGIRYAVDMGAKVINLGFGGLGSSQVLKDAVDYALAHGSLVVAAAGNGGLNTTYYPAAYPGVISVGSVDSVLNWSLFSSSGETVSLVAPGVGVYSTTLGGGYGELSGTSVSSAHVSGVAALLAGLPNLQGVDNLRSILLNSAFDLGQPGKDVYFGYGIVHAYDALKYSGPLLPTPTPFIEDTPTPGPSPTSKLHFMATNTPVPTPTLTNPHNGFSSNTDECALCHRSHTAKAVSFLTNSETSPAMSNDFCLSCHLGGATTISTHSNADKPGAEATFELLCIQCHDPHGTANLYNIRENVQVKVNPLLTTGPVAFTALTGTNSFDEIDSSLPESTSANIDDLCVTCHQDSNNPGYPMHSHTGGGYHSGNMDYRGQDCTTCHPHSADASSATRDGFMPMAGSCIGCHSTTQGSNRIIVGTDGDFRRASHHVIGTDTVTDSDCQVCHDQTNHMSGVVRLKNVDTPATVYALDGISDPADYESFCLSCHDSNGANGNSRPFSDNTSVMNIQNGTTWTNASHNTSRLTFNGSCLDCHDNGHGSNKQSMLAPWNYTNDGNTDDGMKQEERFCYTCHDADGPAATNVMSKYTLPTRWVQSPAGANNLTTLNDRHDVARTDQLTSGVKIECTDCHNVHADNATWPVVANPDPNDGRTPGSGYFTETGGNTTDKWSDWCLDCHDGSYPATITPPTNSLWNIYSTFSGEGMGSRTSNNTNLAAGTGYAEGMIIQCRQCHGFHVVSPTSVTSSSSLFSVLIRLRNASNTADLPMSISPGGFGYEITNNNTTIASQTGGDWCNTCHNRASMDTKTDCYVCHYHGNTGQGGW